MTESVDYRIGAEVSCSDGICGHVSRVVLDPVARALTHLVVEPRHGHKVARLVPLDLVADTSGGGVVLRCSAAELEKLDAAEERRFVQGGVGVAGHHPDGVWSLPYVGLGPSVLLAGGVVGGARGSAPRIVTTDAVPFGEVEVLRGEEVHATDGEIGHVQALVIDPRDHRVTHVLLEEGHLWGSKEVAIPIQAVTRVDNGICLNLTKQQVKDLPPVEIDRPKG
jgi:sporulation protein YlmC with PRC-barrel domain